MARKIFALALLALLPALALAGEAEERLKNLFNLKLDDPRVTVEVLGLPDSRFAVVLKGEVEDAEDRNTVLRRAEAIAMPNVEVFSRLELRRPAMPRQAFEEVTELWPLTYIRSRVSSTGTASSTLPGVSAPDNIDILVEAYNRIYGAPDRPPVVQRAGSNRLLLHGSQETVTDLKRSLAIVDAPWPQVQLNLWAIQVSGSAEKVADRIRQISQEIRTTQDQMAAVQRKLTQLAAEPGDEVDTQGIEAHFRIAGIDLNPRGPLSLNESLVLLLIRQNRQDKVLRLRKFVEEEAKLAPPGQRAFHRLERALAQETFEADRTGFVDFRNALACFKDPKRKFERPEASNKLVRTGATVDRLLKAAMDAFATDMDELFLEPLLTRIQAYDPANRDDGIALTGRSRIVVTSGLEAGLTPEMASFVETTRPKPFGQELLNLAFPASESGGADGATAADALTGASRVLASLPEAQAMLLAAALLAETEPTYSKVAPGIAINARPTVLPDGGSARLTIDARFGVTSEPLDATERTDVWAQAPPAGISSHHIRTDTNVSAFDLFEISSFSIAASHPQSPFYVPILGRLPVIGRAFQIPRRNKQVHFESLVLVNTVILPRALQLNRFYESRSHEGREEVECEESWKARVPYAEPDKIRP
ncbi:MAG TPA: hypothetical protein VJ725_24485 [Thermoanaerobaculia bacterium]|nr:hypothetical protein [Thermoanaerobaculia bacterium]